MQLGGMFYVTGTNDKAAPAPSKSRTSAGTSCKHFDVICIPSPANETPLKRYSIYDFLCLYGIRSAT